MKGKHDYGRQENLIDKERVSQICDSMGRNQTVFYNWQNSRNKKSISLGLAVVVLVVVSNLATAKVTIGVVDDP